jgi:cobalamin biosynthesis protein CobD/CbiB
VKTLGVGGAFVNGWNDLCHPSVWIKKVDEILKKPTVRSIQTRITKGLALFR